MEVTSFGCFVCFSQTETPVPEIEDANKCGDCYGAKLNDTHCCNTCQDVIDAYREKRWQPDPRSFEQCKRENYVDKDAHAKVLIPDEGCQIYGHMEVNRVSFTCNLSIS